MMVERETPSLKQIFQREQSGISKKSGERRCNFAERRRVICNGRGEVDSG